MNVKLKKQGSFNIVIQREKKTTETLNRPIIYPINNYKLHEEINLGGFGCIYKATDLNNYELVSIKYSKENMEKEYRITSCLKNCKNIPQAFSFGQISSTYYIIMQYLNLDMGYIKEKIKTFKLNSLIHIAIQIITTLQYVHQQKIRHRDIKPENIMIKFQDPKIYLIDFGIALEETDQSDKNIEGTILYDPRVVHKRENYRYIDDLEMFGYCLYSLQHCKYFQFYKNTLENLPWEKYIDKESKITEMKQQLINQIIQKKEQPLYEIFQYVEQNQMINIPDYQYLIENLLKLQDKQFTLDWIKLEQKPTETPLFKPRAISFATQMSKFFANHQDQLIGSEGEIQFVNDQLYKFMN